MRIAIAIVLLGLSTASQAADRKAKVQAVMEAQGLVDMFQQQIDLGKQYNRTQAQQMLDQFMGGLKSTPEFDKRFRQAYEAFAKSLEVPWSAQEIVDVWASSYGKQFTDDELDQMVKYYTSPLGKKDVAATQKALPEVSAIFAERAKPIVESATQRYIADLELIAKECKCRK